jgi:hypothetical protein
VPQAAVASSERGLGYTEIRADLALSAILF